MSHKNRAGISKDVVYDDAAGPLIGVRLHSTAGKVDYDYDENAVKFNSGGDITNANDRIVISIQYAHSASATGKIHPHLHWEQTSTNDVIFTLQYRLQGNGQAKTTAWTTMTARANGDSAFPYVSGTLNQITMFNSEIDGTGDYWIDMTGIGISATTQWRLARTDSTTGDVLGTFYDFHFEIDSDGSRYQYIK